MTTLGTATNYSPTLVGVSTQLGLSVAITLSGLVTFELNRRWKLTQHLYHSRCYLEKNPTPLPPPRPLAWIWNSLTLKENFYLTHVGLDAVMYIRFLEMAFQLLLFTLLTVGAILMPLNFFAQQTMLVDVDKISIGNIPNGSSMFWIHWLLTYFFSASTLYLLLKNTQEYIEMRTLYLQNQARKGCVHTRTVIVTHIPDTMRHEERLRSFYASLGLGEVDSVTLVRHTGKISRKIQRRENMLRELEYAHIKLARQVLSNIKKDGVYALKPEFSNSNQKLDISQLLHCLLSSLEHSETTSSVLPIQSNSSEMLWSILARFNRQVFDQFQSIHKTGVLGTGQKVVSIDYYLRKFNSLDRRIAELRHATENAYYYKPTSTAFITFKTQASAQLCSQTISRVDPRFCHTKLAPEPRDILWRNHTVSSNGKWLRRAIVNGSIWALTVLWLFPSTYFVSFASYEKLSERWPSLVIIGTANPWLKSVIQNVLPSLLISLFMVAMPNIFLGISMWECFSSYSSLESAVVNRYYRFAIFNVLFVFLLGFAFIEVILEVIQTPTSITSVLAKNLPQGAAFFINYVILQTASHGLEIAQIGSSLFYSLLFANRWYARTPRDLQNARRPWSFPFYYYFPTHILVLVICITYSIINPLILLCGVMYFGIALIVYKYQFAYVYVKRYEYNALKEAISPSIGLVPLLGGTVAFKVICRSKFRNRMKYIPLECLCDRDSPTEAKETMNTQLGTLAEPSPSSMNQFESSTNVYSPFHSKRFRSNSHGTNPSPLSHMSFVSESSKNTRAVNLSTPSEKRTDTCDNNTSWLQNRQSKGLAHDVGNSNHYNINQSEKIDADDDIQPDSFELKIELYPDELDDAKDSELNLPIENPSPRLNTFPTQTSKTSSSKQRWGKIQQQIIRNPLLSLFLHPFANSSAPTNINLDEIPPIPELPCRETYQDDTNPYETYIHPDFIRPLPKRLWLPKDPFKKLHDLDNDIIEFGTALHSSLLEGSAKTNGVIAQDATSKQPTNILGYLGHSLPRKQRFTCHNNEHIKVAHKTRQANKAAVRYDAIFNTQTNQLELVNSSKTSLSPSSNEVDSTRLRKDPEGFIHLMRSGLVDFVNKSEILLPWTHKNEDELDEAAQGALETDSVRSSVSSGLSM
ncbi:hypothetical protein K7432_003205 [Basidiobolus ranarum]|uniref:DUF221-domain-containing protein n=1 Tax=Basidiobolus ranarum TaxID=34480 RepID=A0ABR2X080_9FUNG